MATQSQLATAANVSQQFISQVSRGICRPSWPVAKRLAEVTGTTPALWLEGTSAEIKSAVARWEQAQEQQAVSNG